jgi:hypothetical protein
VGHVLAPASAAVVALALGAPAYGKLNNPVGSTPDRPQAVTFVTGTEPKEHAFSVAVPPAGRSPAVFRLTEIHAGL